MSSNSDTNATAAAGPALSEGLGAGAGARCACPANQCIGLGFPRCAAIQDRVAQTVLDGHVAPADDGAARYTCRACGTTWHGSKLEPRWRGAGKECGGRMEKCGA